MLIDVIRAVPTLVLIFFFYYFAYLDVFEISPPSGFTAVLLTLVIAQACYTADLIRAAIDQVSRVQVLGVEGIGFKPHQVVRYVVVPSVFRWLRGVRAGFRFFSHEWMPTGKSEHLFRLYRLLYRYEDRWRKTANRVAGRIDADPEPNTGYRSGQKRGHGVGSPVQRSGGGRPRCPCGQHRGHLVA